MYIAEQFSQHDKQVNCCTTCLLCLFREARDGSILLSPARDTVLHYFSCSSWTGKERLKGVVTVRLGPNLMFPNYVSRELLWQVRQLVPRIRLAAILPPR
jgi:hypothetical protein